MPTNQVTDHLGILAFLRNRFQRRLDYLFHVGLEKGLAIHRADELPGVHAVAVVHQPAKDFAERDGLVGHAGRDDAGIVAFDLVIRPGNHEYYRTWFNQPPGGVKGKAPPLAIFVSPSKYGGRLNNKPPELSFSDDGLTYLLVR